jgi:hypothetical protein
VIETTAGKVSAELAKRGLDPDDRVTITIEPGRADPRAPYVEGAGNCCRSY